MARKDALVNLRVILVKRRDALRSALAGDLSLLKELRSESPGDVIDAAYDSAQDEISSQLAEVESRELANIENALDKVDTLDTFYYEANELAQSLGYEPVREVGLSAQQVLAVMPEVVAVAPIDPEYLTVRYERLLTLAIAAIKELRAEVKELRGER